MRKFIPILVFLVLISGSMTSCNRKTCAAYTDQTDTKKTNLTKKKYKRDKRDGLWNKKMFKK